MAMVEPGKQNSNPKAPSGGDYFRFGCILGMVLGLMSAAISIRLSQAMGKPDAFIREAWIDCHGVGMGILGTIAGMAYGTILSEMAQAYKKAISHKALFLLTLLIALPVFLVADYFAVIYRHGGYSMLGHLVVFLSSLAVALFLFRRKRRMENLHPGQDINHRQI